VAKTTALFFFDTKFACRDLTSGTRHARQQQSRDRNFVFSLSHLLFHVAVFAQRKNLLPQQKQA
jgi:hypothetical protein